MSPFQSLEGTMSITSTRSEQLHMETGFSVNQETQNSENPGGSVWASRLAPNACAAATSGNSKYIKRGRMSPISRRPKEVRAASA